MTKKKLVDKIVSVLSGIDDSDLTSAERRILALARAEQLLQRKKRK